jgi:3-hydroxybutyrate dehydrogenase
MKRRKWGRIVNIASIHGLVASPNKSAYVAAKHGLVGLTKTVALEVAQMGITVNAICPGYAGTAMVEKQIADQSRITGIAPENVVRDVILVDQPTKRLIKVDHLAALALYLTSDAGESITGAALSIDGGWTAR